MISHNVGLSIPTACWIIRCGATALASFGLGNEAIHLPIVYVGGGIYRPMRPTMIQVL
jgi:hypothetical protein